MDGATRRPLTPRQRISSTLTSRSSPAHARSAVAERQTLLPCRGAQLAGSDRQRRVERANLQTKVQVRVTGVYAAGAVVDEPGDDLD